jgi:hypothetical protein
MNALIPLLQSLLPILVPAIVGAITGAGGMHVHHKRKQRKAQNEGAKVLQTIHVHGNATPEAVAEAAAKAVAEVAKS